MIGETPGTHLNQVIQVNVACDRKDISLLWDSPHPTSCPVWRKHWTRQFEGHSTKYTAQNCHGHEEPGMSRDFYRPQEVQEP